MFLAVKLFLKQGFRRAPLRLTIEKISEPRVHYNRALGVLLVKCTSERKRVGKGSELSVDVDLTLIGANIDFVRSFVKVVYEAGGGCGM